MRGFYCMDFIEYMTPGKSLLNYNNSCSSNDYQNKYDKRKRKS